MSEAERKKKRLVSFADIAARQTAGAGAETRAAERAEPARRVTYADLAALSRRPEDFSGPPLAEGVPVSGTPAFTAPATGGAKVGTPDAPPVIDRGLESGPVITGTVGTRTLESGIPGTARSGVPETGIPKQSPLPAGIVVAPIRPGRQIRQAFSARDGHSLGEQAVYDALWSNAQPYTEQSRIISAGYRAVSSLCRLTVNNCKANIQSLIAKRAVEEVAGHSYTQAKTYLVFSEPAIMRRRAEAGQTHYIKSRGIVFVNPETGIELGDPVAGTPETLGAVHPATAAAGGQQAGIPDTGVEQPAKP